MEWIVMENKNNDLYYMNSIDNELRAMLLMSVGIIVTDKIIKIFDSELECIRFIQNIIKADSIISKILK